MLEAKNANTIKFATADELSHMQVNFDRRAKVKFSEIPLSFLYNDVVNNLKKQEEKYQLMPKALKMSLDRDPFHQDREMIKFSVLENNNKLFDQDQLKKLKSQQQAGISMKISSLKQMKREADECNIKLSEVGRALLKTSEENNE